MSNWIQIADKSKQGSVYSLCGYKRNIYAGMGCVSGDLYKWDKKSSWIQEIVQLNAQTAIYSLCLLNDEIYGATYPDGKLFKKSDHVWIQVADTLKGQYITKIRALSNILYASTAPDGYLFQWNGKDAWIIAADKFGIEISDICFLNKEIYGVTQTGILLKKIDKTWIQVAPGYKNQYIFSLCVLNNEIYGGTFPDGYLLKWNGKDAWIQMTDPYKKGIQSLLMFRQEIYAGTEKTGSLLKWDGKGSWILLAETLKGQSSINTLLIYGKNIYGGTFPDGMLFKFNPITVDFSFIEDTTTVYFKDLSVGGVTSWLWDFGDGEIDVQQNPVHIYIKSGQYTVSLTVNHNAGIKIKQIQVTEPILTLEYIEPVPESFELEPDFSEPVISVGLPEKRYCFTVLRNKIHNVHTGIDLLTNLSPTVCSNVIYDSSVAVHAGATSDMMVVSNTIDTCDQAFNLDSSTSAIISSNSITFNNYGIMRTSDTSVGLYYNNLFYTNIKWDLMPNDMTGNIGDSPYDYPGYVDRAGRNYHLGTGSPNIDAGQSTFDQFMIDFDGANRR